MLFGHLKLPIVLTLCSLITVIAACGDIENNNSNYVGVRKPGTGIALSLPISINLGSAATLQSSPSKPTISANTQNITATDPGTDYSTDQVSESFLVDANIAKAFVNIMLCLVDSVNATGRVNQGVFLANVPANLCSNNHTNTDTMQFLVNSTRANNQTPQFIQIWFNDVSENIPYKEIIEIIIYQEVSQQYPFAKFAMNSAIFTAASVETPLSEWRQNGSSSVISSLKNGLPRFEFMFDADDFILRAITQITAVDLLHGQSRSKIGSISNTSPSDISESIFNANYNLEINAGDVTLNQCSSRTKTISQVWAYNLYNAYTGERIPEQTTPLIFEYIHSGANDRENLNPNNPVYGQSYILEYIGPSSDLAIPLNALTFMHDFDLKDGTLLTGQNATRYLVKAVNVAHQAMNVDMANCADLDASAPSNNPDLDLQSLPAITPPAFGLSDWPTL